MSTALRVQDAGPGYPGEEPGVGLVLSDPRLPAPIDKAALRSYLAVLEDPEALELQQRLAKAYDAACRALIGPNDVQKEGKGEYAREFKKKSAWRKLSRYFGISTVVLTRDERFLNDAATGESVFVATCTVRGTAPWGQSTDATAACATDEETGRRKITIADAIATAETRASNRATSNLVAMGEVSAEETTREQREEVVQKAAEEMTVDEAKAIKFPWRQPEKYRDKPLGELSLNMLGVVLKAVTEEIDKKGSTPRRVELKFATELLIADREMEAEAEPASETGATAAATTAPTTEKAPDPAATTNAPAKLPDPVTATRDQVANALEKHEQRSFTKVSQSITTLLANEKFDDAYRAAVRKKVDTATSLVELVAIVEQLEQDVGLPF
jgi:hypothetical protein